MLKVTCDCGRRFQVSEQEAGKRGACPCGQVVQIPGPPSSETVSLAGLEYETSTSREWPSDEIGSPRAGDVIGLYALVRKLGTGGMGEVWLGRDEHLDREVAIKFLHAHVSRNQVQLRRFMREAKLMAKLDHPHVVRVIHLGDTGDHFYLVIEYVRGGSLEDHVRETGPLPWQEATRSIRDAASGLAEAHRQGLIHRDIKPANLLRTPDGRTKVSDFGLARHLTQGSELTQHGTLMGSPYFMAPEQWDGKPADERTDLYGLTCSYYFLLTGKPPFQAEELPALSVKHRSDPLPDVRRELPTIPKGVERILQRGSQKDPDQRYQSASELLTDLEPLLEPELASDTLATVPPPREVAREPTVEPAKPNRSTWRHGTKNANSGPFTTSRLARTAAGLLLVILLVLAGLSWPLIRPQLFPGPSPIADNAAASDSDRPTDATDSEGDGPQPPLPSSDPDDIVDTSGDATSDAPSSDEPSAIEPTTVESRDGLDVDVEAVVPPSTAPVATVVPLPPGYNPNADAIMPSAPPVVTVVPLPAICLLVVYPPDAEVTIEGATAQLSGEGAARLIEVADPAEMLAVEIVARAEGYRAYERQWIALAGARERLEITLDPLPAVFELQVSPEDAEVFVEGGDARVRGRRTPRRIEVQRPVAGDELEIVVRQEGFSQWRTTWRPMPGVHERGVAELTRSELSLPSTITNSIGMKLALIPVGEFLMGSPADEPERDEDEAEHPVRITKPFYMGVTEVTQEQYQRVMGSNPSWFSPSGRGSDQVAGLDTRQFPVERVPWEDAVAFCEKLSALPEERGAGRAYRLPTEAEWEYACRAGTTTPFHFGLQLNGHEANCNGNIPYGTTVKGPYLERPTAVGSYAANDFGLYDMHGNVREWCSDWFGDYPSGMVEDPKGATAGSFRVIRGGSWFFPARRARSAIRNRYVPSYRIDHLGFRVASRPLGEQAERPAR